MNDVRLLDLGGLDKVDAPTQPVDGREVGRTRPERLEPAPAKPPLLPPPGCFLVPILTMMPSVMLEESGGVPDVETIRHVRRLKQLGLGMGLMLGEVLNRIGYTWNCFLGELPEMTEAEAEMHLSLLLDRDVFRHDPVNWASLKPKQQERTMRSERQFVRRMLGYLRAGLRWEYWLSVREQGQIPAGPIPRLDFSDARPGAEVIEMWRRTAKVFERAGFTGARAMEMMVEMILYGFLERAELPGGVGEEVWAKAFHIFDLGLALSRPTDALGTILPEYIGGGRNAFFPTPLSVGKLMVEMAMAGVESDPTKAQSSHPGGSGTFSEPAAGTGRLILLQSNHSLDLSGVELNYQIYRALLANMWLYVPWAVAPLKVWRGNSLIPIEMWDETIEAQQEAATERRHAAWETRLAWFDKGPAPGGEEHRDALNPAEYTNPFVTNHHAQRGEDMIQLISL